MLKKFLASAILLAVLGLGVVGVAQSLDLGTKQVLDGSAQYAPAQNSTKLVLASYSYGDSFLSLCWERMHCERISPWEKVRSFTECHCAFWHCGFWHQWARGTYVVTTFKAKYSCYKEMYCIFHAYRIGPEATEWRYRRSIRFEHCGC